MQIHYDGKTDLLYMCFDDRKQQVMNKRLSEDIVSDEAQAHKRGVLETKPDFSVESYTASLPYRNEADRGHYRDGLLKTHLPV